MSTNFIHSTAIVDKNAKIGRNVVIGAYSVIGSDVVIGNDVELKSHVVIEGNTIVGDNTKIFSFACIGSVTQDKKYNGEESKLVIGKNNIIREYVTINPGTYGAHKATIIGNDCLLMISSHVAHDCIIGNNVILSNNATLGGHVVVEDNAILGGMTAVHQFVRIGRNAMVGGMTGVELDVCPYTMVKGPRASMVGLNLVGLKRHKITTESIRILQSVYEMLFSPDMILSESIECIERKFKDEKYVQEILKFLRSEQSRGICKPKG
jgi:UDP-N-acetylglucosamine acyltransferase